MISHCLQSTNDEYCLSLTARVQELIQGYYMIPGQPEAEDFALKAIYVNKMLRVWILTTKLSIAGIVHIDKTSTGDYVHHCKLIIYQEDH